MSAETGQTLYIASSCGVSASLAICNVDKETAGLAGASYNIQKLSYRIVADAISRGEDETGVTEETSGGVGLAAEAVGRAG